MGVILNSLGAIVRVTQDAISPKNKILIIHHDDDDGLAGGAVIYNYLIDNHIPPTRIVSVCTDYGEGHIMKKVLEKGHVFDMIYIVDISFKVNTIHELTSLNSMSANGVIWFDHHSSSYEVLNAINHDPTLFPGFEKKVLSIIDDSRCGALIAFNCLYDKNMVPEIINRVDDYDRWKFCYDDTERFHYGFHLHFNLLGDIGSVQWKEIVHGLHNDISPIVKIGEMILEDRMNEFKNIREASMIITWVVIDGNAYSAAFINNTAGSSKLFADNINDVDIAIKFSLSNDLSYKYTVYTVHDEIECNKIAAFFGGGGHRGAAGFRSEKDPIHLFKIDKESLIPIKVDKNEQ